MSRDIKFKAWDRHNKVWLGPYTFREVAYCDQFNYDTEVKPVCSRFEDYDWTQFIGLTDIKGKDIYEGDIVKENQGRTIGVIKFVNGSFVSINGHDRHLIPALFLPHDMTGMENTNTNWYEVIGNIYEHPELIPANVKETQHH